MKTALNEIEEKKILFEKHIEEYVSRGYELISTTNLGYGLWFFWRKVWSFINFYKITNIRIWLGKEYGRSI